MSEKFTLADCPTPYPPWLEAARLPEIVFTIPLEPGESLAGATVEMFLERPNDTLEKTAIEVVNVTGKHAQYRITWTATDLVEGPQQLATFRVTTSGGLPEALARFFIDVLANPDPTP